MREIIPSLRVSQLQMVKWFKYRSSVSQLSIKYILDRRTVQFSWQFAVSLRENILALMYWVLHQKG